MIKYYFVEKAADRRMGQRRKPTGREEKDRRVNADIERSYVGLINDRLGAMRVRSGL